MNRTTPYGVSIQSRFGENRAGATSTIHRMPSAIVAHSRCDGAFGLSVMPAEPTLMVVTHLRPLDDSVLWIDGKLIFAGSSPVSTSKFIHLDGGASSYLNAPFDTLEFYLPRSTMADIATRHGVSPLTELSMQPRTADPQIECLARLMLNVLDDPTLSNPLFDETVILALYWRLVAGYGGLQPDYGHCTGGLTPAQEARAKEMIDAHLGGNVSIAEIAEACGLSPSYFKRAFKVTTGVPPHRWLTMRRIELAKSMLLLGKLSISEVAISSGFADQSHMTRVFARLVGVSPGSWQRLQRR
ncbi:MAG: AraC family transcriptional regulator [Terracidiphilus sp.]|nr:AraC family transcriptional regulator [Terracidiphilus sp.]